MTGQQNHQPQPQPGACEQAEPRSPEVAVLIVGYNSRDDLAACLPTVLASDEGELSVGVVVVDNASSDGTAEFVAEEFPQVHLVRNEANRGFAGGNNAGWEAIGRLWPDVKYVALLNPDTEVESRWLSPLVAHLEANPRTACVQPKVMLHPETDRFNTVGNRSHYLGFGIVSGYRQRDCGQYDQPREITTASGAAMLMRAELPGEGGLFWEEMFMYAEDVELSWRWRQGGWRIDYCPGPRVLHKYTFSKNYRFYFYFERNRWLLLLSYYRLATLVLLAPALAMMEAGQVLFAAVNGALGQKLRSWGWFLRPANVRHVWRRRREVQRRRVIGDRAFMRDFVGRIDFAEVANPLLRYVANPLLGAYWWVARRLIFW
jgi:GT2 family glycosyltransferase